MNCEATSTTIVKLSAAELYEQEHLMYIRFNAPIVEKRQRSEEDRWGATRLRRLDRAAKNMRGAVAYFTRY